MSKPRAGINTNRKMFEYVFTDEVRSSLTNILDIDFDLIPDQTDEESVARSVADASVIIGTWGAIPYTRPILAACPDLELIVYGAGAFKGYLTDELLKRDPVVCTSVHLNAIPTAEYSLGLILMALKDAFPYARTIDEERRAGWNSRRFEFSGGYYKSRVGILGFGTVSRHLLRLLRSFDVEVLVADDFMTAEAARDLGARKADVDYVMANSDVVSIHHANIERNWGLINERTLDLMKPGARLINTSRGKMIDEEALVAKLKTGAITAYLDVTHPEPPEDGHLFYTLPNCIMTPHIAGAIGREVERFGEFCLREIVAWIEGSPYENRIDIHSLEGRA